LEGDVIPTSEIINKIQTLIKKKEKKKKKQNSKYLGILNCNFLQEGRRKNNKNK
jgi:hypothetical protein